MQAIFNTIFVIVRIFSNSFSNVFQKKLACDGENPINVNFINYLLLSVFSLPLLILCKNTTLGHGFWQYAIFGGIMGAICNCFMALALKRGELSVLGPINSYKAIVGMAFGVFILHEFPNIYGLCGIVLIIVGSYFILESPKALIRKDIQYRIYALIFSAIEAVFIKKVIVLSSITVSFIVSSFLGALFSFLLVKIFSNQKISIKNSKHFSMYLVTALCFGVMTFATAYVFKYMNVGYALSLFQLSIILNVILGYKLFREKNILKKFLGSLIIIFGSVIIILFGH